MSDIKNGGQSIIITKFGGPVAKLVPIDKENINNFDCMQGTVSKEVDLTAPIDDE